MYPCPEIVLEQDSGMAPHRSPQGFQSELQRLPERLSVAAGFHEFREENAFRNCHSIVGTLDQPGHRRRQTTHTSPRSLPQRARVIANRNHGRD
jgi:hypothetical protein